MFGKMFSTMLKKNKCYPCEMIEKDNKRKRNEQYQYEVENAAITETPFDKFKNIPFEYNINVEICYQKIMF